MNEEKQTTHRVWSENRIIAKVETTPGYILSIIVAHGMVLQQDDWEDILELLADNGEVTTDDLPDTTDETVLEELVELGWLEETATGWGMGWKAEMFATPT